MKLIVDEQALSYNAGGGLEISIQGCYGDSSYPKTELGEAPTPTQLYVEIWEDNLRVHFWNGDSEEPVRCLTVPMKELRKKG
jgi:hypothetical protein